MFKKILVAAASSMIAVSAFAGDANQVEKSSKYGDGEDAGHHADHVGGFAGVGEGAAKAFAEADQHFRRNQRAR